MRAAVQQTLAADALARCLLSALNERAAEARRSASSNSATHRAMDYRPTTIESNERRWRDGLVIILLPLSLLLLPIGWPLYFVRRFYWLRFRGFWVTREGRDAIEYQELHKGRVESLTISGEMMVGAPHVVYVPTEEEWRQTMPEWASGRRDEIIANVKRKLGTKRYEYDYS